MPRWVRLVVLCAVIPLVFTGNALGAGNVVISQIYGGGGNSGAPYSNDYVELFNRSTSLINLSGWSMQYASATGTGNFGSATNLITPLDGFLAPGQYVLVEEASGGANGVALPSPRITDATPINMSATGGKVALVSSTTPLGCNGSTASPCSPAALATIVDLIGYDGANFFEGAAAAPTLSNTTAALRQASGCQDTDDNANDFAAGVPSPRTLASPTVPCGNDFAPVVTIRTPPADATGVSVDADVSVTFSEAVDVTGSWFSIACGSSGPHTATVTGGPTTFTLDPDLDFTQGETCTVTVVAADVTDQDTIDPPDNMPANETWSFATATPPPPPTFIHDIQAASHLSPLAGQLLANVPGTVTAKRSNGFYMQDPNTDANDATSEGIFVFTSSAPTMAVGDSVSVRGTVSEFRPGGASTGNLTTTELVSPVVTVLSSGNALPAPIVLGTGGRIPPSQVIEDDASGDVETSGVFDPATDGLDFYESAEGMRVQLNDPVAVGPTNSFGETPVVGDNGANAGVRTPRGGVLLRPDDGNPERLVADDVITPLPSMNVGDRYAAPLVGVMDYNFGNFLLEVTSAGARIDGGLAREVTAVPGVGELTVSTFNFENLDANDPQAKFDQLASMIVANLRSPDLISGEEVQDNSGATNNGVVDASQTLAKLVAAVQAAGGPAYDWREIDPVNNADGGEPGGNIRQVFLFRSDRGLSFVDRPGGTSTAANAVTGTGASTQLVYSPGRLAPTNAAFDASRKPLAAEFLYRGHKLFAIANHFNSKGGDDPLMGRFQPPTRSSEVQRHQQADIVGGFVSQITAADPSANVIVLGDLNDFEFSETAARLRAHGLHYLVESLPLNERYSYEFEGNAQGLDHILASDNLFQNAPFVYDAVHVNAEFADQASDHDPEVVRFTLNAAPSVSAGGPYAVDEGSSLTLTASGSDPEGGSLSYAWDLDDNGTFETAGQLATFASDDGPATRTVKVRVTDDVGVSTLDSATITVANVAPRATFAAPASTFAGFAFALSLTSPSDPSQADTVAGFGYAFDCGSGYGAFGSSPTRTCPTTDVGTRQVGGRIRDKDGGISEYHASVNVVVTFTSLCQLTRAFATDQDTATVLCKKLEAAAADPSARTDLLAAYRKQVDAKTGKVFTAEQAAILKQLSTHL